MDQLMSLLPFIFLALIVLGLLVVPAVKIVYQYQRGVLFRFGKFVGLRKPGLNLIIPWIDRLTKVDLRTRTVILKPQEPLDILPEGLGIDIGQVLSPVRAHEASNRETI